MNYAMPLKGAKSLPAWELRQSRLPLLIRAVQGTFRLLSRPSALDSR
jgi:hypothetical protein